MTDQGVKLICNKCKKEYEATVKGGLRPRDFVKPRVCPECKQLVNMSGATKPTTSK